MSVENRLLRGWGAGCMRSLAIRIIAGVIVLCVASSLIVVTMVMPLPADLEEYRPILWALGFVAFLGLFTVGAVALFLVIKNRRAGQFDAIFGPLGLHGSGYLTNGRQYHGQTGGRQADVYFYRGPTLDLYLASPLRTRMGIGNRSALGSMAAGMINRPALQTNYPELSQLAIYPIDERWGGELLEHPQARAIIQRLMNSQGSFEIRNLLLQPESIQLKLSRIHLAMINAENVRGWFSDLQELANIAEGLPAPSVTAQPSSLERSSRTDRNTITRWVVISTLLFFGLLLLCSLAIIPLGIWLGSSGY
ncbi:MAG: hypothetical protein JW726_11240 [Anaerolineales bacterium]|nr:hypothetical protein [Anaerolineales bacterium]